MEKKKFNLKEKWKDKRERAKIELALYGIFFLILIIFVRIENSFNSNYSDNIVKENKCFINDIADNYEYDMEININNVITKYHGKKLGYNSSIIKDDSMYYYNMNNKYYVLDDSGNYILTNEDDVFSVLDYKYLDVKNVKEYIKLSDSNDNVYNIKISDIILNSDNNDNISITIYEDESKIIIDYTNLFNEKTLVSISYSNINKIISLEE